MMNKAGGYIAIHRQILDWEWYKDTNTFRLFMHLLLSANFVDGRFEGRVIQRGQLVTSLTSLAKQTTLSVRQVRVSLDHLMLTGEVTSESCNRYRVITIVKYDEYQKRDKQNDRQVAGEMASKWQADDKQMTGNVAGKWQQYNKVINNNNGIMEEGNNYSLSLDSDRFDAFWQKYPKKVSKVAAIKAWKKIKVDDETMTAIMSGLEKWKLNSDWLKENGRYIPYPASWLNDRRWEDEVPQNAPEQILAPVKTVVAQQYTQRPYGDEQHEAMMRMIAEARRDGMS